MIGRMRGQDNECISERLQVRECGRFGGDFAVECGLHIIFYRVMISWFLEAGLLIGVM